MNNIVIVTKKPFPEGFASTIRLTGYARGLIEAGCNVDVHCIYPTETKNNKKNIRVKGVHKSISFEYTCKRLVRSTFLPIRIFYKILGFLLSALKVLLKSKKEKYSAVILVGPFGFFQGMLYYFITAIRNIKYIQERTEYPYLTTNNGLSFRISLWIYLHISCKLFDGIFVISESLNEYYTKYISKKAKSFILPIIVDTSRFSEKNNYNKSEYIGYCGSMDTEKDGIEFLITAFKLISNEYPGLTLKLIGNTNFPKFNELQNQINELGIAEKVEFTGRVENDEMVILLKNAKILALARPLNEQTKGNFPTKLGEYLATGNPVVTTKVGVVTDYLIHKENAYLAEPSNADDFARVLKEVLDNYSEAIGIAKKGKGLTKTTFNYSFQAKKLLAFIKSL